MKIERQLNCGHIVCKICEFSKMSKNPTIKTLRSKTTQFIQLYLKELGFDTFQGNMAWRHLDARIEAVKIGFVRPCDTSLIECTSASFDLASAIYLKCFHRFSRVPFNRDQPLSSQLRKFHRRTLEQQNFHRGDIWLVEPDGSNLEACVADALKVITQDSEPWFLRFRDDDELIQYLLNEAEESDEMGLLLSDAGPLGCPNRNYVLAYLAKEAGQLEVAKQAFERLLEQSRDKPTFLPGYTERDYACLLKEMNQVLPDN